MINSLDKEPLFLAKIESSKGKGLREIWNKLVAKYENADTLITELREELKKMPVIRSNKDLSSLKTAREIAVNVASTIALSKLPALTFQPLILMTANKLFERAQWEILAKFNDFSKVAEYMNNMYKEAENFDRYHPLKNSKVTFQRRIT